MKNWFVKKNAKIANIKTRKNLGPHGIAPANSRKRVAAKFPAIRVGVSYFPSLVNFYDGELGASKLFSRRHKIQSHHTETEPRKHLAKNSIQNVELRKKFGLKRG